jgi:hypothetical protein
MRGDPVIEELWRIKDEIAAEYNYDIRAMGKALQEAERRSGRQVVSPPPREKANATQ